MVLALTLLLSVACRAGEPYVTATYAPAGDGYWVEFAVHNELNDSSVAAWYIATEDALSPVGPVGWQVSQNFREVKWTNWDHPIPAGQALGGFTFTAQDAPGTLRWWMLDQSGPGGLCDPCRSPRAFFPPGPLGAPRAHRGVGG